MSGVFQALPPDLLAHVLQLSLGPEMSMYVGGGRTALLVPIRFGSDCRGFFELRLVCKAFRYALMAVPLHVTASSVDHIRSLARQSFRDLNIAAVELNLSCLFDDRKPRVLVHAASHLPDRERKKVVTLSMSGNDMHDLAEVLREGQLEGLCHMIINRSGIALVPGYLDCLSNCFSNIERLDMGPLSVHDVKVLVSPLLLLTHATRIVS